jgi:hypothetical protein
MRTLIKRIRRQRALRTIRRVMAFFGYDLEHLTDEELLREVHRINRIRAATGLPLDETIKADGTLTKIIDLQNKRSTL